MFNPLLDAFVDDVALTPPNPWQVVSERIQGHVEAAYRAGRERDALKWLNVLDLVDREASAYWSVEGWRVYGPC